jgi:alkanesulfonate monooxygenase SsuD/methylene tetrahydromethanopterin reductase-like flavin-dependent oxidoreductase (luciferase family)
MTGKFNHSGENNMSDIKFMWRIQPYPTEGSNRSLFVKQITDTLEYIQGKFDGAFLDDHLLPFTAVDHSGGRDLLPNDVDVFECMTTLSYLAGIFPKLVFGPIVLCQSYRNPALVARMGANIQQLTNGRFVMGIGAGWYKPDYDAYGYEYPEVPSVRLAQMEEAIQIIYKMWKEPPATFEGKYYRINNAYCSPTPDPIPPLMIGGGGEKIALRLVAKYADWWNYCDTPDVYAHKLAVLRSHCDVVGRNFDEIVKTWDGLQIAIAETEVEARRIYETSLFKRREALVGTPVQIAENLKAYVDLGVKIFFLRFDDFPSLAGLKLFTEKVMPLLK